MPDYLQLYRNTPFRGYTGEDPLIFAGPCGVESREQLMSIALPESKIDGVHGLRGGAFKPRTHPYDFQGLGEEGLRYLVEAKERTGLSIVTEIPSSEYIDLFLEYGIDVFQVGSRNAENHYLLKELQKRLQGTQHMVLLKRGKGSSLEELHGCLEYLHGVPTLVCLRGIQKFDYGDPQIVRLRDEMPHQRPDYRFFVDIDDIPKVKSWPSEKGMKHVLGVGFDPSHSTGKWEYVEKTAKQAVEHGADFLLIECVLRPDDRETARCDGRQAITVAQLENLILELREIYRSRFD